MKYVDALQKEGIFGFPIRSRVHRPPSTKDRVILPHEGVEMTPDVMRALAISGSILIAVVLLIIVVTFVAVRRGEGLNGRRE